MAAANAQQRITFGVELEMLVPYLAHDEPDPANGMDTRRVIRLSQEDARPRDVIWNPVDEIRGILREFLRSHGVPIDDDDVQEANPPTSWSMSGDISLNETNIDTYGFAGTELRSPAFLAEADAFNEVERVVSLLTTHFQLRINETTGFHVHVGLGAQALPPRAVLRLAQFLWCADGMLSQLHPPERMIGGYSPSIRHRSYLARGELNRWQEVETVLGDDQTTAINPSAALSDRLEVLQQDPTSIPALDARPDSFRLQRLPSLRTNPYEDTGARQRYYIQQGRELETFTRRQFLLTGTGNGATPCTSVLDGLRALCQPEMYRRPARAIEQLSIYIPPWLQELQNTRIRANYNCLAYELHDAGDAPGRRTIEFREAAGSLNPSWVAAWAKICSRIVGFCLEAEEDDFVEVLMRVVEAELAFDAGISRYDVIDLLHDLGLGEEAKFVEQNILKGDKNLFWFPCCLGANHPLDPDGPTVMVPPMPESQNRETDNVPVFLSFVTLVAGFHLFLDIL